MKNWLPLVSGPEFAIASVPFGYRSVGTAGSGLRLSRRGTVLVREPVRGSALAGALRVAALQHEDAAGGQPVALGVVEELLARQVGEARNGAGRAPRVKLGLDDALVGGDRHQRRTLARVTGLWRLADVGDIRVGGRVDRGPGALGGRGRWLHLRR